MSGFVAVCTDVTTDRRNTTARAHLFLKVSPTFEWRAFNLLYPSSSGLHQEVVRLLGEVVSVDTSRFELLLKEQIVLRRDAAIFEMLGAMCAEFSSTGIGQNPTQPVEETG
jgi:hypothetical protein